MKKLSEMKKEFIQKMLIVLASIQGEDEELCANILARDVCRFDEWKADILDLFVDESKQQMNDFLDHFNTNVKGEYVTTDEDLIEIPKGFSFMKLFGCDNRGDTPNEMVVFFTTEGKDLYYDHINGDF